MEVARKSGSGGALEHRNSGMRKRMIAERDEEENERRKGDNEVAR